MDLMPTFAGLAGRPIPIDYTDGVDIWPVLTGEKAYAEREALLFFDGWEIQCIRWGPWKLHVSRYNSYAWTVDPPGGRFNLPLNAPELYHIDTDSAEAYDRASEQPELVKELLDRVDRLLLGLPEQARTAWRDTRNRRAIQMPTGALPQRPQ
jgi:arylsulfatase